MRKNAEHALNKAGITQLVGQVHAVAEQYHCHSARAQRISYDIASPIAVNVAVADSEQSSINVQRLQGLSFAQHRPFGEVVLKWQLCLAQQTVIKQQYPTVQGPNPSCLLHESAMLQRLKGQSCSPALLQTIEETVVFLKHDWQLTVIVISYYPLGSLKNYSQHNELTNSRKVALLLALAQSILTLHQAGWTHGDLKPSNILIATEQPDLQLLLNDFALAMPIPTLSPIASSITVSSMSTANSTALILPKGTPAYLAPECWQGQGTSIQSDIYAFGIMLFEILTGTKPYQIACADTDTQEERLHQWAVAHCQQPVPKLPASWQQYQPLLDGMLAKTKAKRCAEIVEIIRVIE
ncbi:protein kinase domain-containing protein [Psychrobacter arenosus]|uniref:protein kinase domain-containing protein n=1 Tax=Psychrobacter arenosus TaxID=256326 RepID=UPI001D12454F|nr:protein kinase [Psychrobacter arenosus]